MNRPFPFFLALIFYLFSSQIKAEDKWLCTESSGYLSGNSTFYSCGVGENSLESKARENALISARNEFIEICKNSIKCRNHMTKVSPGRTDCRQVANGYKCYRMVEYTLTSEPKPKSINSQEIEMLIKEKEEKARELINQIQESNRLKKLNDSNKELEEKLQSYQIEREELYQNYNSKVSPTQNETTFRLGLSFFDSSLEVVDYIAGGWELSYQKRIFPFLGIEVFGIPYFKSDIDKNSTYEKAKDGVTGNMIGIGVPVFIGGKSDFYIQPEYSYRRTKLNLTRLGISSSEKHSQSGYGLKIGKDFIIRQQDYYFGLNLNAGATSFSGNNGRKGKTSIKAGIGFNIGW